ncbi:hypothetical protein N9878_00440 [bacterium]|nr:hypothetical protein [bacterium]
MMKGKGIYEVVLEPEEVSSISSRHTSRSDDTVHYYNTLVMCPPLPSGSVKFQCSRMSFKGSKKVVLPEDSAKLPKPPPMPGLPKPVDWSHFLMGGIKVDDIKVLFVKYEMVEK